jgi:hypothetical protein
MLYEIEILEARWIADLAATVRRVRDQAMTQVSEAELGEPRAARGEHHPAGALSLGALPESQPARRALRQAIERLTPATRRKIWAVTRIGGGDYAKGDWDEALAAADGVPDDKIVNELAEEVDLHDRLMKGLYEIGDVKP